MTKVGVIMHYIVIEFEGERVSFIVTETLKNVCFFSVFYYYCKKSTGFLPNKRRWMRILSAILALGFIIEVMGVLYFFATLESLLDNTDKICYKPIFIVLGFATFIMVYMFLAISILITRNVRRY